MTKFRIFLPVLLYNILAFLIMYGVAIIPIVVFSGNINTAYAFLLMLIPFFFAFIIKTYCKKLHLFILFNALLFVSSVFFCTFIFKLNAHMRIFSILFVCAIITFSFFDRMSSGGKIISSSVFLFGSGANFTAYILSYMLKFPLLEHIYIISTIIMFASFIISEHVIKLDYTLSLIERTTIQPIDKILRFNSIMAALFVFCSVLLISIAVRGGLQNLLIQTAMGILWGIRFLVRVLSSDSSQSPKVLPQEAPQSGGFDLSELVKPGKPSFLLVLLEKILMFCVSVLIIVGVVFGIGYFLYSIYKRFYADKSGNGDIREFLLPEIFAERTGNLVDDARNYFSHVFTVGDNNKKVRRIFFKRVEETILKGADITDSDTSSDIREKIKERDDVSGLTLLYQKARYADKSTSPITDAEVAQCKK